MVSILNELEQDVSKVRTGNTNFITLQQAIAVAEAAATSTVNETFTRLGMPIDGSGDIKGMQEDMSYLRKTRTGSEEMKKHIKKVAIGVFVLGLCTVIWQNFADVLLTGK